MAVATGNVPLPPHMNFNFRRIRVGLIGDNTPSKRICFSPAMSWSKALKRSGGSAMMVLNLALPSEHFEGFRPAHCRGKAYTMKTSAANDGESHKQQSTESGRGRYGEDDDDNRQGQQQQRARTTTTARTRTVRTMATRRR
jgi:hypothetical protein